MYYKTLAKNGITGYLFGMLGGIIRHFYVYIQNVFICYYCLVIIFLDKNLWFSSQRRREGVVGDANNN